MAKNNPLSEAEIINTLSKYLAAYPVDSFGLFGSFSRGDYHQESDIDVLVEFEPGHTPGFAFFELQDSLSHILGRKVDMNTPNFLSPYFRDDVIKNAQVEYVEIGAIR
ncbi:MAG: nucleotidyltransferase family protein [Candidatus Brocadiae bacterium]|nr:nucleotidyltransferase family protein [Candidatus Brocadiia bacterium]